MPDMVIRLATAANQADLNRCAKVFTVETRQAHRKSRLT